MTKFVSAFLLTLCLLASAWGQSGIYKIGTNPLRPGQGRPSNQASAFRPAGPGAANSGALAPRHHRKNPGVHVSGSNYRVDVPLAQPRPPRHHPHYYPAGSETLAPRPYISDVRVDDGKVKGYHVVSPAIEENPFGILQPSIDSIRSEPSPPAAVIHRFRLAEPSAREAEEVERNEYNRLLLASKDSCDCVAFSEKDFVEHALPLVRELYREKDGTLILAYTLRPDEPTNLALPEASLPTPSDTRILHAFRSGTPFQVLRSKSIRLSCGACHGKTRVRSERILDEQSGRISYKHKKCSRCSGSGSIASSLPTLYLITKK